MMEGLRQWIISLTALCMLLALLRVLVPGGTMGRVAAFVGGLVLLAALARPLSELGAVRLALPDYAREIERLQRQLEEENEALRWHSGADGGIYIGQSRFHGPCGSVPGGNKGRGGRHPAALVGGAGVAPVGGTGGVDRGRAGHPIGEAGLAWSGRVKLKECEGYGTDTNTWDW